MAEGASSLVLAQTIVKNKVDLSGWSREVELRAQEAVYQLGRETRDMARRLVPVKTGALRASIYVTRPGSAENQAAGKFARGRASAGYFAAANAAARLNPGRLEFVTDDPLISKRTQRDLSPSGDWNHLKRVRLTRTHTGERFGRNSSGETTWHQQSFAHLGTQEYAGFEEDWRSIMPMADVTRGTFLVTIGASAYYAGFVEYGTVKMAAQPFMTPAVNWARGQLAGRLTRAIGAQNARVVTRG